MLITPKSLCAQVLKAKYLPNSTILPGQLMKGMSYSFRSIFKGFNSRMKEKEIIYHIGYGRSVNIWTDCRGDTGRWWRMFIVCYVPCMLMRIEFICSLNANSFSVYGTTYKLIWEEMMTYMSLLRLLEWVLELERSCSAGQSSGPGCPLKWIQ
jgi:hypothetical protein